MFPPVKGSKFFKSKWEIPPFGNQYVDIIIPYYEQYEKVFRAVQSIIYNTKGFFRICVVDDCSPNTVFLETAFQSFPNVKTVRNHQRLGFGASLKVGADALSVEKRNPPNQQMVGGFPWLVFLHSDCEIMESNWLLYLGQTMLDLKRQGIKMVSAMTDNPTVDNSKLYADSMYFPREDVILAEDDFLPLYCAMCHRDLFKNINGFVKPYPYAGYEDIELSQRMRRYGYKQAVCGTSWIHHEGKSTIKNIKSQEIIEVMKNNKTLCEEDLKK